MTHYLDYNATAPVRPEVTALMQELQNAPLNPSSAHTLGRKAKGIVEDARRAVAEVTGAFANEVIFTSSGTEGNNTVLRAFADCPLLVSAIEHSSILQTAKAIASPSIIPATPDGVIDLDVLESLLPKNGNFLLSLMLANNETGVLQPVRAVADMVHKRGGLMHCDAVQASGKIPVDFTALGCDFMTIAAHKMGGPVGVAALVVKNNLALPPLLTGGRQELGRRAGTENVAAIAGFARALELLDLPAMKMLRSWLETMEMGIEKLEHPEIRIIGKAAERLPNTVCLTMPKVSSETQLIRFDLERIAVSAGSACSSGRIEPSYVLEAMHIESAVAATAIRISGGWATTEADIKAITYSWIRCFTSKNT